MRYSKIVIIGVGLIGGSIGKALLKEKTAEEVIGVCRRDVSLERALSGKTVSGGYVGDYREAVKGAELVIIATPVETIKKVIGELAAVLDDPEILVTDVGSTKKEIVDFAKQFEDKFTFIGAHPLAGSEKAGVEYADEDLFRGAACIITSGESVPGEKNEKLRKFWESMGANVIFMTPEEHDSYLAFSSHLPHIVASALVGALGKGFPIEILASGFKDTTRIASSDQALWSDIYLSNKNNLLTALNRFKEVLSGMEKDILEDDGDSLQRKIEQYRRIRDEII